MLAAGIAMSVLYGLYDDSGTLQLSTTLTAVYNATSRAAWAVAVSWVIVACATGHGVKIRLRDINVQFIYDMSVMNV